LGAWGYVVKARAGTDLLPAVEAVFALRSASSAKSVPGMVKREEPQSKQTKTFGNTRTPGLSMFLTPLTWIIISVVNSA